MREVIRSTKNLFSEECRVNNYNDIDYRKDNIRVDDWFTTHFSHVDRLIRSMM